MPTGRRGSMLLTVDESYQRMCEWSKESALLASCSHLLEWEEQTYMPAGGVEHRGNQVALLARLVHERRTDPQVGDMLESLAEPARRADVESPLAVNVREWRRQYRRATKLPAVLVAETARTISLAQHHWANAKKASRFADFEPWLERVLKLKREAADCLNENGCRYDALLDEYEPGAKSADIERLFGELGAPGGLTELVAEVVVARKRTAAKRNPLEGDFPIDRQKIFGRLAAATLGFDFQKGRIVETPHPFCSTIGPGDCRLTTRYSPRDFSDAFFSTLHETGHGLYEQGLDPEHFGTPLGEAVSLGVHESQSRLWENFVGRGRGFWEYFWPIARHLFGSAFEGVAFDDLLQAVNATKPSLIRVDADPVTYNLHVLVRFQLEVALIDGDLAVADVPAAWNQKYRETVGVEPANDREGCLQDVHWSAGLFGYFPTYTLGNCFAAQLFEAAKTELGDLDASFGRGDFSTLLAWLRRNVHRHGCRYSAAKTVERVVGEPLSVRPLLKHLRAAAQEFVL